MTVRTTATATVDEALVRPSTFGTVLVANRGEIACRIIRTLHRMGVRAAAVYSDADRTAQHVLAADVSVRIGPAAASASYLDVDAVVAAAVSVGADAIHPGYGFLSENPALAEACTRAGIVFIGPGAEAMTIMGDKIRAKAHVSSRGVPIIDGVADPALDDGALASAALRIGFPLMVKPAGGGGGKGMQVVLTAAELPDALASAHRIAASAFGDPTLLLERLVEMPRHIEVQVLADRHGNVVHLGERECSLQRRHQKVIEESPSPLVDDVLRRRLGQAACDVAASVEYVGVGTVEFLVSGNRPDDFAFLEMNTRLQVEHPVTELVTGLDLVEWQLRVAAGEALPFGQDDIVLRGHAMEARVYAEDPDVDFLPQTGTVLRFDEPVGAGVRVDAGIVTGDVVGPDYDPMLAKIISWGADRTEALGRLDRALADTVLFGVRSNLWFLRTLLADTDVRAGRLDTGLISRVLAQQPDPLQADEFAALAAGRVLTAQRRARAESLGAAGAGELWNTPSGWRIGRRRTVSLQVAVGDRVFDVDAADPGVDVHQVPGDSGRWLLDHDGRSEPVSATTDGLTVWLSIGGRIWVARQLTLAARVADAIARTGPGVGAAGPEVRSPMPGTVTAVQVATGEYVEVGALIAVVEAMKMEHRLTAEVAGTVTLHVVQGAVVAQAQSVATIEPGIQPDDPDQADPTNQPGPTNQPDPPAQERSTGAHP